MKSLNKLNFVFCVLLVFINQVHSQVALYSFSQYTAPYVPITGGTILGNTNTDDQVFINPSITGGQGVGSTGPGMPLGFTISVNGVIFDRIGINSNGFVMLATSSVNPNCDTQLANAYLPISSTSTALPFLQNKVVGFGMDLQGQLTTTLTSELRMQTVGSAPNRTAVVQWSGFRKYNNSGDNINFQIKLCETSGMLEVSYGSITNNTVSATVQVGLRGNNVNDFNNRFVNAISNWLNSSPGPLVTSIANFNNNLKPFSGLNFRWTPPPICNGVPATNTVVGSPLSICPGGASTLALLNTYTNSGLSYQWQSSTTSSTGPFVPASNGATSVFFPNNILNTTWYQCIITCANNGQFNSTPPTQIQTLGASANNVPYTEDFEGIILNNQLPNCSWSSSSPSVICQTYTSSNTYNRISRSGSGFAAFRYGTISNGDLFYTNALKLNAGITYSASVWYVTNATPTWNYLSIMYGPNQSTTGLVPIATITNNINNITYQPLSNTFSVSSTGLYYIAIRAYGSNTAWYLSFDDISITAPCDLNDPNLSITSTSSVLCSGEQSTLSIVGANTTTWSTGSNSSTIVVSPPLTSTYIASATYTNTGCVFTASQEIVVNPTPVVSIIASPLTICNGSSSILYAIGASTYSWSSGSNTNTTMVSPTINTTYSVIGINSFGCSAIANLLIGVLPKPNISGAAFPNQICIGETATVSAFGGVSYIWEGNNSLFSKSANYIVSPNSTVNFTLTGKGTNGCETAVNINLFVSECTNIDEKSNSVSAIQISPNPFNSYLYLYPNDDAAYTVQVTNSLGKICYQKEHQSGALVLENNWPSGLYIVTIKNGFENKIIKMIKE